MNPFREEDIEKWKEIIISVRQLVQQIGFADATMNMHTLSQQSFHAIIHLNQAREQIEHAIEALTSRIDQK